MSELTSNELLKSVSRSFYLSIRILPRRLRDAVGLAYLLARTTDTIADTTHVSAEQRAEALRRLASVIQGEADPDLVTDLRTSFAPQQTNEAECKLIEGLSTILQRLELLNAADRGDIRELLTRITHGQTLDITRPILATAAELNEYSYLVAGCVGEFWTHVCFRYIDNFATLSENEMIALGTDYGRGLQLTNILRDLPADLAAGRCYFPQSELEECGISTARSPQEWNRFAPIYYRWLEEAQRGLDSGMQYVRAINHFRVRAATALPALIGARTLALLRAANEKVLSERVKVPRKEVRAMIAMVTLTLADRNQLEKMFRRFSYQRK